MITSSASPAVPPDASRARWRWWLPGACAAALFVALLWPRIGSGTLWHHDELLTANRAREMLVRHDAGTVTFNFSPDFRKPPLQYWLAAAALRAWPGQPEFAVRLPSLLGGAVCLLALAWLARRGDPEPGKPSTRFATVLALAGCGYFIHYSRVALLDTGAALFLTLAVTGCHLARRQPRWWWFVGFCGVLGAWQKAPYVFGAWMMILLVRRFERRETTDAPAARPAHLVGALIVALLMTAGWWLLQGWRHGFAAVLAAGARQAHAMTYVHDPEDAGFRPYLYWYWMTRDWAAFGLCAPLATVAALWTRRGTDQRARANLLTREIGWVCAVFFIALAFTPYRAERYLIVITPLLALLTARWLGDVSSRNPHLLPASARRWLLPLAVASTIPVATFHYFSKTPAQRELRAAARDLGEHQPPGATALIVAGADPAFEVASFVAFYADLRQPWRELTPEAIAALPPPDRGVCRVAQWDALRRACPGLRRVAVRGEWIVWERWESSRN